MLVSVIETSSKVCSKKDCFYSGKPQSLKNFYKEKRTNDGYRNSCKLCFKRFYENNKEQFLATQKKYQEKNKDKIKNYQKANKKRIKEYRQRYNQSTKAIEYQKDYYRSAEVKKHKKEYNATHKKQRNEQKRIRRENNINVRLAENLRTRLNHAIKDRVKSGSAVRDMCCSIDELKKMLESMFVFVPQANETMTWDNYGVLWEIDHVLPLSSFDLTNREQLLKAVHFSNLRPMWASQNRSEKDRGMSRNREIGKIKGNKVLC